jgi:RHS repeat-associated protein
VQADPQSGVLGTTFRFTGTGFSPNSTASLSVYRPNGTSAGSARYGTDSLGHVSFSVASQSSDPSGWWTFVLADDSTSRQASTTVQYTETQSGTDVLKFISDVTYPDDSQVAPGSSFTKTWRLQNAGTSTWASYTATFVSSPRNSKPSVNLHASGAAAVAVPTTGPGQTINLSIPMRAPSNPGTYYSYWELRNTSGVAFGVQFYVRIRVVLPQGIRLGYGTQSGRGGTNDSPEAKSARNADPVNTATGNYNYASIDLRVPGRGLDIELARSYNSQDTTVGPVGTGWSHTLNIFLANITSSSASVHYSDGKTLDFINQAGTNNFVSSYPGYYDVLIKNSDATWTLKKTDQRTYNFDSSGKLVTVRNRNSNQLSLAYSSGNLIQVTDTVGRAFIFTYSGALLTRITDPTGRNVQFSYDANSNLVSFRDANGNTNTYSYDANKRLIRIVDGRGNNLVVNAYGANCPPGITSCVSTQTNGRGNLWTFTYNSDGSTSVFDPFGKETKYVQDVNFNIQLTQDRNAGSQFASGMVNLHYDDNNNRDQLTDQKGNPTAYVYDQNGNVLSRTDPTLTLRQAVYDSNNNPTRITDELGKTTQMSYDTKGNLTGLTDPLNNSSSTTHNSFGQPLTVTDSNGNITTYTYDSHGNLTSVKDPLNNVTSYTYDGVGRRLSMTDARGKITRYSYDANDNLRTVTDPQGGITAYTYDANNNRLSMRDPRSNTTTYAYDENNLLIKETDAKGFFVQHTYDKLDRRISTRDKRGNVTNFAYDNEGRLVSVTDPLGNITRYTYDANGNRTQVTDAKNQTTVFTYDAMNRVTNIHDALSNSIQKTYDGAGRLARETDPQSNVTEFTYDAVGNLTQVKDAAGGTAKYSYDKRGNRITQTDPNNKISNLAYDKLNRLLSTTNPLNHISSYTYDEVGNRISQTDAKGSTTRYSYDGLNRLILITYPSNSTVQFTRDANGNVTRMVDSLGITAYVYDELDRMTSVTDPFDKTIGYQYDENGNITRLTYPDGKAVAYQFDANNRMVSFTDWATKRTTLEYDSTNLLTKVTYPNGIVTSFTYDTAGRLIAKSDSGVSSYSFTLDKNGNRISANISQPLGNRLYNSSQNYTYDAANRIQNAGSTTFTFDNNGNMTSKTEAGVATTYNYDFENRLVSVGNLSQYFYNGEGVRLQKIEGNKTTRYVVDTNHDLSQVLCETDAIGVIAAYYVYGAGLAYKVDPNGIHYYYSFDPLGSTIALTDDAKNVVNSYAYDPFGLAVGSVENTTNPFTFVGEYGVSKDANGLLFMRARYYNALTGTFINVDPTERDIYRTQDLNPFSYAANNPVNEIDPAGLFSIRQKARQFGDAVKNKVNNVVDAFKDPFNPNAGVFRYGGPLYNATGWSQSGICGPGNKWLVLLEKVVPDRPFGFDGTGPCANHDAAYGRIRSSLLSDEEKYQLRLQADQAVRAEIKSTCLRQGGNYDVCTILGELYFAGVRIGGPLAAYGFDWNATMLDYARMIRPKTPCPF